MKFAVLAVSFTTWIAFTGPATAEVIRIGVTLSTTGPAASIGIPIKNALQILPKEIDGVMVAWTILDDGSDTTLARQNVEKLVASNVDLLIGSNTTPTALATVEVAGRSQTPELAIAPSPSVVEPVEGARTWVFKVPLGERELAERTIADMAQRGIKSFAFIGFNDAYSDGWLKEFDRLGPKYGIKIVAVERYGRTDSSVVAQVLKMLAIRPDAIFIAATGTPAVLPTIQVRERGFKGLIYQTSGVVNNDFLRIGGKSVEGVILAGPPLVVAAALPDSNPSKAICLQFTKMYEAAYGRGTASPFAGNAYDAWLLIHNAATVALKTAKPGTPEFHAALRNAIENTKGLAVTNGVINLSPTNHGIYASGTPVMLTVHNGAWALAQ